MQIANWKDIAEVLGISAIVASLIFVGLQMKQSQEIAIASQYQSRFQTGLEFFQEKENIPFWVRKVGEREIARAGIPPGLDKDASVEEIGYRFFEARKIFLVYDNHYFQYQSGFMIEEVWDAYEKTFCRVVRLPTYQHYWETFPHAYRSSFNELVEKLLTEEGC